MRSLILVVAALAISSCTPTQPPGVAFAQELAGYVAGPPKTCVSTFPDQNLRAIDSRTIAYGYGRTISVNRLGGECPGLAPLNTIIAEVHGSQYCRGDRIRALEPGAGIPGPWCNLGDWVPYRMP